MVRLTIPPKFVLVSSGLQVSGDDANLIHVWQLSKDQKELEKVHTFKGHRAPVSGLSFRKGTHTLYSSSHDRSVKVWNLDEMMYIETL